MDLLLIRIRISCHIKEVWKKKNLWEIQMFTNSCWDQERYRKKAWWLNSTRLAWRMNKIACKINFFISKLILSFLMQSHKCGFKINPIEAHFQLCLMIKNMDWQQNKDVNISRQICFMGSLRSVWWEYLLLLFQNPNNLIKLGLQEKTLKQVAMSGYASIWHFIFSISYAESF